MNCGNWSNPGKALNEVCECHKSEERYIIQRSRYSADVHVNILFLSAKNAVSTNVMIGWAYFSSSLRQHSCLRAYKYLPLDERARLVFVVHVISLNKEIAELSLLIVMFYIECFFLPYSLRACSTLLVWTYWFPHLTLSPAKMTWKSKSTSYKQLNLADLIRRSQCTFFSLFSASTPFHQLSCRDRDPPCFRGR